MSRFAESRCLSDSCIKFPIVFTESFRFEQFPDSLLVFGKVPFESYFCDVADSACEHTVLIEYKEASKW